jgi:hypothetical protein
VEAEAVLPVPVDRVAVVLPVPVVVMFLSSRDLLAGPVDLEADRSAEPVVMAVPVSLS